MWGCWWAYCLPPAMCWENMFSFLFCDFRVCKGSHLVFNVALGGDLAERGVVSRPSDPSSSTPFQQPPKLESLSAGSFGFWVRGWFVLFKDKTMTCSSLCCGAEKAFPHVFHVPQISDVWTTVIPDFLGLCPLISEISLFARLSFSGLLIRVIYWMVWYCINSKTESLSYCKWWKKNSVSVLGEYGNCPHRG